MGKLYLRGMEFGRVPSENLDSINFALPPDPVFNEAAMKPGAATAFRFGLSHWGRAEWVGKMYPPKTPEKNFLPQYAKHFNSVELNATHYKNYGEAGTAKWKEKTDGSFVFCPKSYKGITNFGNLADKQTLLGEFVNSLAGFGHQLGPVFISLPDNFSPSRKIELGNFLSSLPSDKTFMLEVRHPHWFLNDDLFTVLREKNIGAVITDTAGRRDCAHMHLTIPKAFIRFVANDGHASDYKRINEWADRLNTWKQKGLEEINFFLHSNDESQVLDIAKYTIDTFNKICNAGLKPLKFYNSNALW